MWHRRICTPRLKVIPSAWQSIQNISWHSICVRIVGYGLEIAGLAQRSAISTGEGDDDNIDALGQVYNLSNLLHLFKPLLCFPTFLTGTCRLWAYSPVEQPSSAMHSVPRYLPVLGVVASSLAVNARQYVVAPDMCAYISACPFLFFVVDILNLAHRAICIVLLAFL